MLAHLWQIMVLLTNPMQASQALFAFQGNWNSYLWPLIVTHRDDIRTLQIGLRYFVDSPGVDALGCVHGGCSAGLCISHDHLLPGTEDVC
jgi:ABC-type glycerol-3-phosphate transport system permease component